jgi:hypothetical protein
VGVVHDNHVLAAWLEAQAAAARGNESLATEAHAQAAFFEEASRGCHRAFLEQPPLELVRRALEVLGQARSGAISSHDAQRIAPAEPSGDGQVTFPLRNRSEGDRGATAR